MNENEAERVIPKLQCFVLWTPEHYIENIGCMIDYMNQLEMWRLIHFHLKCECAQKIFKFWVNFGCFFFFSATTTVHILLPLLLWLAPPSVPISWCSWVLQYMEPSVMTMENCIFCKQKWNNLNCWQQHKRWGYLSKQCMNLTSGDYIPALDFFVQLNM